MSTEFWEWLMYADIEDIFRRLDFGLSGSADLHSQRACCRWYCIPADLEEIARIYGYDRLPVSLPQDAGTAGERRPLRSHAVMQGSDAGWRSRSDAEIFPMPWPRQKKSCRICANPTTNWAYVVYDKGAQCFSRRNMPQACWIMSATMLLVNIRIWPFMKLGKSLNKQAIRRKNFFQWNQYFALP